MILSTLFRDDLIEVNISSPTAIEPAEKASIKLRWTALQDCSLTSHTFEIENAPVEVIQDDEFLQLFPIVLEKDHSFEWEFLIRSQQEGFGVIHSETILNSQGSSTVSLKTDTWLSVFEKKSADKHGLSYELRKRLMEVVNFRPRNGHIFLANYELFFNDFLNIDIPEVVAGFLNEEFGFSDENLPVDDELRYLIIIGNYTFYGIEVLELLAEEDCNESDDRFDPDQAMEVKKAEV